MSSPSSISRHEVRYWFAVAWLAWVLSTATKRLIRYFPPPDAELNGDAFWTYLPNARKFLEQPWAFLTTNSDSYHVAPLGYVWAAVWGADPVRIQLANCVLFLGCVILMWRCATQMGGIFAGVVATGLLVYHPNLTAYIPQVLTESIFLFGLMLCTASLVEYALTNRHQSLMLGLMATGLTITLLSRPVLQLFALVALVLTLAATGYLAWNPPQVGHPAAGWSRLINRRLCVALLAALLLPTAVIVKNGLSFDVWGLGTGAGSGLYYGVSPFKMGLEPVYSGFKYDAGVTPLTVDPNTKGNPLTKASDRINTQVALEIVNRTSFQDNVVFFGKKLSAWTFYSTPELRISHKLRTFRSFELLVIGLSTLTLALRAATRDADYTAPLLPGATGKESEKFGLLILLLLLSVGMVLQLAAVLYNTRYNIFFLEPWLMLLSGVGAAILLQWPIDPRDYFSLRVLPKVALVLLLTLIPQSLTKYAQSYETWRMDPYRPGPTAVLLDGTSMGPVRAFGATPLGSDRWRLDASEATLVVPLEISAAEAFAPHKVMDALWRIRLSVSAPYVPDKCRKAMLAVSPAHTQQDWYEPEPSIALQVNSQMHTYAIHGNDQLRPAGNGELAITFTCPVGTVVTWAGAELIRSTMPEAARALILHGQPIDPYLRREPSWSSSLNH